MRLKVVTPVKHDDRVYQPGETFGVNDEAGRALIEAGAVERAGQDSNGEEKTEDTKLEDMNRSELEQRSTKAGVENPEGYPNKAALIEAIKEAEG